MKRSRKQLMMVILYAAAVLCFAMIVGAFALGVNYQISRGGEDMMMTEPTEATIASTKTFGASNTSQNTTVLTAKELYASNVGSVVGIATTGTTRNIFGQVSQYASSGTGFVITEDGYILTNYHVVENGTDYTVTFSNGDTYDATVVAYEADNDIAVIKIEATGLTPVTIGSSDTLSVGDTIYAIGNPLGELTFSLTDGLVSALDRNINIDGDPINMFQINAAVNSGNSGGPVFNDRGEVVGIVTAKYSDTGVEGLSFAIPINDIADIVNDILTNGYVTGKAYFGITVSTLMEGNQFYGTPIGAYVTAVDDTSCAATAGLQVGDIITKIDNTEITTSSELVTAKKQYSAGDSAVITVTRGDETIELNIVFDEEKPSVSTGTQATEPSNETQSLIPYSGSAGGSY